MSPKTVNHHVSAVLGKLGPSPMVRPPRSGISEA
ncbi:hypothetical protein [Devosia psychrophila]